MAHQQSTKVADLMTREVVTLNADEDLVLAEELMRIEHFRHLPVVRGGRLVGLVTHRDLLRAQARILAELSGGEDRVVGVRAADLMTPDPRTVSPELAASEAARIMLEGKLGCLPVLDEGRLVGIVTEADFLRWAMEAG